MKVRVLEDGESHYCDIVKGKGSSWHFNSLREQLRRAYFQ
jgi:hypothetical protein